MISETKNKKSTEGKAEITCGIVMPISSIGECNAEHWKEVLKILKEVAIDLELKPNLVSDADDIGIIQKRIIQNLYENDIVICDVSEKNPNVMFELGIRLAFDKPTIIIKDDCTNYSFDTSVIEHLTYPRDLTYWKILDFKTVLAAKIKNTLDAARKDKNYSTFLKNFGEFKVAKLDTKSVTQDEYMLAALEEVKSELRRLRRSQAGSFSHGLTDIPARTVRRLAEEAVRDYCKTTDTLAYQILQDEIAMDKIADFIEDNHAEINRHAGSRHTLKNLLRGTLETLSPEIGAL